MTPNTFAAPIWLLVACGVGLAACDSGMTPESDAAQVGRLDAPAEVAEPTTELGSAGKAAAAAADDSDQLLLAVVERDPWRMVIGSDGPLFALYADRSVIFQRDGGFWTTRLDEDAFADLQKAMLELRAVEDRATSLVNATDQMTTLVNLPAGDSPTYYSVYGAITEEGRDRVPAPLLRVIDLATDYSHPAETTWTHDYVEVMIWPFDHARGQGTPWPAAWPGLDADGARCRGGENYSFFLPIAEREAVEAFIDREERQHVLLDGRKWSVQYRLPFPHETEPGSAGRCPANPAP